MVAPVRLAGGDTFLVCEALQRKAIVRLAHLVPCSIPTCVQNIPCFVILLDLAILACLRIVCASVVDACVERLHAFFAQADRPVEAIPGMVTKVTVAFWLATVGAALPQPSAVPLPGQVIAHHFSVRLAAFAIDANRYARAILAWGFPLIGKRLLVVCLVLWGTASLPPRLLTHAGFIPQTTSRFAPTLVCLTWRETSVHWLGWIHPLVPIIRGLAHAIIVSLSVWTTAHHAEVPTVVCTHVLQIQGSMELFLPRLKRGLPLGLRLLVFLLYPLFFF